MFVVLFVSFFPFLGCGVLGLLFLFRFPFLFLVLLLFSLFFFLKKVFLVLFHCDAACLFGSFSGVFGFVAPFSFFFLPLFFPFLPLFEVFVSQYILIFLLWISFFCFLVFSGFFPFFQGRLLFLLFVLFLIQSSFVFLHIQFHIQFYLFSPFFSSQHPFCWFGNPIQNFSFVLLTFFSCILGKERPAVYYTYNFLILVFAERSCFRCFSPYFGSGGNFARGDFFLGGPVLALFLRFSLVRVFLLPIFCFRCDFLGVKLSEIVFSPLFLLLTFKQKDTKKCSLSGLSGRGLLI